MRELPKREIVRVASVGIGVPSPNEAADEYERLLHFRRVEAVDGRVYLTCGGEYQMGVPHHNLVLLPSDSLELKEITLEVVNAAALDTLAERLSGVNVEVEAADEGPGVSAGITFLDPAGDRVFCRTRGKSLDAPLPPSPMRPYKLGHVNRGVEDPATMAAFYMDILGFRLSDRVGEVLYFLRCNSDHHSLGFRKAARNVVHHIAFEVAGWQSFLVIADNLAANGSKIEYGPGRHRPGHNLFMYFKGPSGLRIETFADMGRIDDDENYVAPIMPPGSRSQSVNVWGPPPPPGSDFMD